MLLRNPVRDYAWGSVTAIPELTGTKPDGRPQAELWMGAHESAPSVLPSGQSLYDAVSADPEGVLGADVAARFEGRFPFLAKLLAAAQPLSIQAHPSPEQARAGFAGEERHQVPRDAGDRNYKDPWPKPEILIALGDFDALVGFRPLDRTVALLDGLDLTVSPVLSALADRLRDGKLREGFSELMSTDRDTVRPAVGALGETCRRYPGGEFAVEARTLDLLCQDFPDDPGVLAAVLLNRVRLQRFEAVYLPAGNVHAYLHGTGFEVMANSDNVLRGGLTRKHVDVRELVSVVDFEPLADPVLTAEPGPGGVSSYDVGCDYFAVRRVELGEQPATVAAGGPRIVACVEGAAEVTAGGEPAELAAGASVFIAGIEPACSLRGRGTAFVVSVPVVDSFEPRRDG